MKKRLIQIFYPFWKLYKFLVLRNWYSIRSAWFIWKLTNRKSIKMQRQSPLHLSPKERKVVDDLQTYGISITHIDELFPGTTWFHDLKTYGESLREKASRNRTKPYWNDMWDVKHFILDFTNPYLRFALEEKILAIANAYLGMYSKLHSIGLSETFPVALGTPPIQSQLWHRDLGNKKYVKVFLYLNDIDEEDGPFIYLKGSQPGGRWYKTFPQINPFTYQSGRIGDTDITEATSSGDILYATGKAGTLIFADTVGLHKGGYSTRNPRFASITSYYSEHPIEHKHYPKRFEQTDSLHKAVSSLSPQAKFATEGIYF